MAIPFRATAQSPLYGFTAFPHDLTAASSGQVHAIVNPNSNLYAIHVDQCVPWHEVISNQPFPQWLRDDWADVRGRIPAGRPVYVAVTPTQMDRTSLAKACGPKEFNERDLPASLSGARFDSDAVKKAYVAYVKRVIQEFKPSYINIAIEISELAIKDPARWPAFQNLYLYTRDRIKTIHPSLKVGLELVLQTLMKPQVATAVKNAVERSDYIGISFYPYGGEYGVKMGAPALPAPPDQWRVPLNWVRQYTTKPIAICETGYTTQNIHLEQADMWFRGDAGRQQSFLKDLIQIAKRDHYLFVVWFVSVDYEKLLEKWPGGVSGDQEWMKIWVNTGLFNRDLQPKPAWVEWQGWRSTRPFKIQPPNLR